MACLEKSSTHILPYFRQVERIVRLATLFTAETRIFSRPMQDAHDFKLAETSTSGEDGISLMQSTRVVNKARK